MLLVKIAADLESTVMILSLAIDGGDKTKVEPAPSSPGIPATVVLFDIFEAPGMPNSVLCILCHLILNVKAHS
jgi:hypothetical protein